MAWPWGWAGREVGGLEFTRWCVVRPGVMAVLANWGPSGAGAFVVARKGPDVRGWLGCAREVGGSDFPRWRVLRRVSSDVSGVGGGCCGCVSC